MNRPEQAGERNIRRVSGVQVRRFGSARRTFGGLALALGAVLLAGCTSGDPVVITVTSTAAASGPLITAPVLGESSDGPTTEQEPTAQVAANGVRIKVTPKDGTKDVPPNNPVQITVFSAKITDLTMTGDDGSEVAGTLSADKQTWITSERLNYGTTYTLAGTATATKDGSAVPIKSKVRTLQPAKTMGIQINIPDGGVVGVAAPIIVTFLGQVADRAAAEKALTVKTSAGDQLEGNWAWVQDEDFQKLGYKQSQVHWRPTKSSAGTTPYWPAGTKVTVEANLRGVNYGGGIWGRDDVVSGFSIRPDGLVVKADASSFHLVVLVNDRVVKNWAVSYGKESVPGRATVNGIHVVTNKYPTYAMCNRQFDYCGANEKWAVRINNNGEFIHQNLQAAKYFGIANVSHGCINMSAQAAVDFYNMAKYGDPVEVVNASGPAMTEADALYDWIFSPDEWKALSAL